MTKGMENTMADTKLFNIKGTVKEYQSGTVTLEKELQTVIENNINIFFGVTFLASEYRTTDGGRMDSIGIDENHCPVIFEYKRSVKENVINQGLFYLNWLLDHKDSFKVLVIEKLGLKAANNIDWSMPRVVCVAGDFTKYDEELYHTFADKISEGLHRIQPLNSVLSVCCGTMSDQYKIMIRFIVGHFLELLFLLMHDLEVYIMLANHLANIRIEINCMLDPFGCEEPPEWEE